MSMNEAGLNYQVFYGNAQNVIEIMILRFNGITYCNPPKGQRTIRAVTSRKEVYISLFFTMGPMQRYCRV